MRVCRRACLQYFVFCSLFYVFGEVVDSGKKANRRCLESQWRSPRFIGGAKLVKSPDKEKVDPTPGCPSAGGQDRVVCGFQGCHDSWVGDARSALPPKQATLIYLALRPWRCW